MNTYLQIGEELNIGRNLVVKPFQTYHVIPSQVCTKLLTSLIRHLNLCFHLPLQNKDPLCNLHGLSVWSNTSRVLCIDLVLIMKVIKVILL
jgi:hypothetical protein